MLLRLYIRNYTLIDKLDMDFRPGFSVITGETGAGKSILLGAIGLLLGQRADLKTLKQGADKCVIEAHFDLSRYQQMSLFFEQNDIEYDAADTIIRRELTATGKSRAFVNDTPVSVSLLKDLGDRLMDVHSQHQNLLLGKHDFQLQVVDTIAKNDAGLSEYSCVYHDYQEALKLWKSLHDEIEQSRRQSDFLQFQYDELSSAQLVLGEQEELEAQAETMTYAEDIKQALYQTEETLTAEQGGVVDQLRKASATLGSIEHVYPKVSELYERLNTCYIELKDVGEEVCAQRDGIDFNPAELDAVNARLDRIYDLQKKYHAESIAELIAMRDDIAKKMEIIEGGEDRLDELKQKSDKLLLLCQEKADGLTRQRQNAAREIERQMQQRLVALGMPQVRFRVNIEKTSLHHSGQDKVSFLFSANTSSAMQSISQVASGGEIARVMLSLKAMISGAVKLPTIIFDEIDTGVSGKIAEQMALIMRQMGDANRQVISITHLPQIAALGTTHYKVYKEETESGTVSRMRMLSADERIAEIAQMLSGEDVSEAAVQNAKELLKI